MILLPKPGENWFDIHFPSSLQVFKHFDNVDTSVISDLRFLEAKFPSIWRFCSIFIVTNGSFFEVYLQKLLKIHFSRYTKGNLNFCTIATVCSLLTAIIYFCRSASWCIAATENSLPFWYLPVVPANIYSLDFWNRKKSSWFTASGWVYLSLCWYKFNHVANNYFSLGWFTVSNIQEACRRKENKFEWTADVIQQNKTISSEIFGYF